MMACHGCVFVKGRVFGRTLNIVIVESEVWFEITTLNVM